MLTTWKKSCTCYSSKYGRSKLERVSPSVILRWKAWRHQCWRCGTQQHADVKGFHWIHTDVHVAAERNAAGMKDKRTKLTERRRRHESKGSLFSFQLAKQTNFPPHVLWMKNKCRKLYQFGPKNTQQKTLTSPRSAELLAHADAGVCAAPLCLRKIRLSFCRFRGKSVKSQSQ